MSVEKTTAQLLPATRQELKSAIYGFNLSDAEIEKLEIETSKKFRLEPSDATFSEQVLHLARDQRDRKKREEEREARESFLAKPPAPAVLQPWAINEIKLQHGLTMPEILDLEVQAREAIHVPHPTSAMLSSKVTSLAREQAPQRRRDKELATQEASDRAEAMKRLSGRDVQFAPFVNELPGANILAQRLLLAWTAVTSAEAKLVACERLKGEALKHVAAQTSNSGRRAFDDAARDEIIARARVDEAIQRYQELAERIHAPETIEKLRTYAELTEAVQPGVLLSQVGPLTAETRQALEALILARSKIRELGNSMISRIFLQRQAADALDLPVVDASLFTPSAIENRVMAELIPLLRDADLKSIAPLNNDFMMSLSIRAQL